MPRGNPNPSPETQFAPGKSGNPGGKSSEQRQAEIANAERATRLRGRMLAALEKSLDDALAKGDETDRAALEAIGSDTLRLIKDSEDRGFGAPTVPLEHTGPNGGPIQTQDVSVEALLDEARRLGIPLDLLGIAGSAQEEN